MQRPAVAEELHEQHTIMIQDFTTEVVSAMRASSNKGLPPLFPRSFLCFVRVVDMFILWMLLLDATFFAQVDQLVDFAHFVLDVGNVVDFATAFLAPTLCPSAPFLPLSFTRCKTRFELGRSRAQF